MAYENSLTSITLTAGANLASSQYFWVKLNTSGQVVVAGDGDYAIGILQNSPASGEAATVAVAGVSKLKVGTVAVVAGDEAASDSAGKAATAATGDIINGAILESGSAADIVSVLINQRGAAS